MLTCIIFSTSSFSFSFESLSFLRHLAISNVIRHIESISDPNPKNVTLNPTKKCVSIIEVSVCDLIGWTVVRTESLSRVLFLSVRLSVNILCVVSLAVVLLGSSVALDAVVVIVVDVVVVGVSSAVVVEVVEVLLAGVVLVALVGGRGTASVLHKNEWLECDSSPSEFDPVTSIIRGLQQQNIL